MSFAPATAGVGLAVLAAVGWAGQYVFIRMATRSGSVPEAMVVSLLCNAALVVPSVAVIYYPDYGLTPLAIVAFVAAGIAGSVLSRVLQFEATRTIGAARTAPVVSSTALVSALLAVVFLDETLTPLHLIGIVMIVGAVAVISRETVHDDATVDSPSGAGRYLLLPVFAAAALGVEPILLKVGFAEGTPTFVGLAVMVSAATTGYVGFRRLRGGIPSRELLWAGNFQWYLGAGIAGTGALAGYFAALAVAPVVVVVPILQAAPLLVVGFSVVFLPRRLERVTPRLVAAAAVVVAGTIIVSLSG